MFVIFAKLSSQFLQIVRLPLWGGVRQIMRKVLPKKQTGKKKNKHLDKLQHLNSMAFRQTKIKLLMIMIFMSVCIFCTFWLWGTWVRTKQSRTPPDGCTWGWCSICCAYVWVGEGGGYICILPVLSRWIFYEFRWLSKLDSVMCLK